MLLELEVRDFAIIDHLSIQFHKGFKHCLQMDSPP